MVDKRVGANSPFFLTNLLQRMSQYSKINYSWKSTDTFQLSGATLQVFADFANTFRGISTMVSAIDTYLQSQLIEGKLEATYEDADGNLATSEDVKEIVAVLQAKLQEISETKQE